ncbi:hypothetical protein Pth03_43960 [Planotetraspora thailandica]|uniref:Uncharacterized protein n=1 Tax=Planotetraspora thailandica TaxID=487172 RepID=A0A8J3V5M3_9ACTN|nr:hypothetical protein Pth03_43960 [Planotetraspora thailandica]
MKHAIGCRNIGAGNERFGTALLAIAVRMPMPLGGFPHLRPSFVLPDRLGRIYLRSLNRGCLLRDHLHTGLLDRLLRDTPACWSQARDQQAGDMWRFRYGIVVSRA